MNVPEYISSGIVEGYVLGLISPEERMEFEHLCNQYPEIQNARIAFELALEKQAMLNAIEPPTGLKQKIQQHLESGDETAEGPVPDIEREIPRLNWLKYAAAACVILLAGSLYWNINLSNKNKKLLNDLHNSEVKMNSMEDTLNSMANDIRIIQQNPNIKMASMKGLEAAPQSFATIYWDTASKDVYLLVNNLPKPATDKQYQLWSILDGKPVDGGLIDNEYFIRQNKLLIRMKNAQGAEAFAITLEKKGGNPTPEGVMYVMGKF